MSKDKIFFIIVIVITAMFFYNNYEQKKALNKANATNKEGLMSETYDAVKDIIKKGDFKNSENKVEEVNK